MQPVILNLAVRWFDQTLKLGPAHWLNPIQLKEFRILLISSVPQPLSQIWDILEISQQHPAIYLEWHLVEYHGKMVFNYFIYIYIYLEFFINCTKINLVPETFSNNIQRMIPNFKRYQYFSKTEFLMNDTFDNAHTQ